MQALYIGIYLIEGDVTVWDGWLEAVGLGVGWTYGDAGSWAGFPIIFVGSLEQKDPYGPVVCPAGQAGNAQGEAHSPNL